MNQLSTPLLPSRPRVALLVDGDNLSSTHAETLLAKSAHYGALIFKRVYGNVTNLNGWCAAPGFKPVHSGTGKNATDLLMSIEAMSLMLQGQADTLIIASSDGDFTHLAQHLTERGQTVIGIGTKTASDRFRKSCTDFHDLAAPPAPPPDSMIGQARALLIQDPQGLLITTLSSAMKNTHQVQIGKTPHKSWRAFLTSHPDQFNCDAKGPNARVRLKL